jgi:16S rRNA processing protein RimM
MPYRWRNGADSARQPPEYLAVGRVIRPHGVRGTLLIEPASELILSIRPDSRVFLGAEFEKYTVRSFSVHQKRYLLTLEEVESRDHAEKFRDQALHIRFEESQPLPADTYYYWQLLGMDVFSEQGEHLGNLAEILETGANDVYVVRSASGEELLLPAIESVIREVDLQAKRLIVHLLPGLRKD